MPLNNGSRKIVIRKTEATYEEKSLNAAYNEFIKHKKVLNLAPDTIRYYESNISAFINFFPENKVIYEVTKSDIENYVLTQYDKNIKTVSINTKLRALRTFLYFCMDKGYMPQFKIDLIKVVEEIPDTYTNQELIKLLRKPSNLKWTDLRTWALINYAVGTGNRLSTIVNVKISDLDFKNKTIRLSHTKNKKQMIIPMSESLSRVLKKYLRMWDYKEDDYLFCSETGTKLNPSTVENNVRAYNLSRGVSRTSVHSFRHSFARNYIIAGGDVTKLQKLLGHSTINMTMKYIKLYGNELKNGYEEFNPLNNLLMEKNI